MNFLKNHFMKLLVIALIAIPGALFAEDVINANDLKLTPSIDAPKTFGKFTIMATGEKNVVIDAPDSAVTAKDGEIFNIRINLKGGGNADSRSVKFTAKKGANVKVYIQSSSKTDARIMKLCNAKGESVAEFSGSPYVTNAPDIGTAKIPEDGEYYLTSASGGMYIFQIIVK
jgi:hypothetical protein